MNNELLLVAALALLALYNANQYISLGARMYRAVASNQDALLLGCFLGLGAMIIEMAMWAIVAQADALDYAIFTIQGMF